MSPYGLPIPWQFRRMQLISEQGDCSIVVYDVEKARKEIQCKIESSDSQMRAPEVCAVVSIDCCFFPPEGVLHACFLIDLRSVPRVSKFWARHQWNFRAPAGGNCFETRKTHTAKL